MKRKWISVVLLIAILVGSQNVIALEVEELPVFTMDNSLNNNELNHLEDAFSLDDLQEQVPQDPVAFKMKEVILTLDSKAALVNGVKYTLLSPPKVIGGRTFLPLRFVADHILEADVVWNNASREVTVTKGDNIIKVKIGSKVAFVNGAQVDLDQAPIIENNVTLLPVRFMSEAFGLSAVFNEKNRTVLLTTLDIEKNQTGLIKPLAVFSFDQAFYTAGQAVRAIDASYDQAGGYIKERLWRINDDSKLTASKLEDIFRMPREGTYKIALRVRNNKGVWSDWNEQTLFVAPNQKPVVTALSVHKNQYAQGEEIRFTYAYENEEWEGIKSERWTYKRLDQPFSREVIGKPKAFFAQGEYSVTLQLEDMYGNMSDRKEIIISITEEVLRSELNYRFTEGRIGDIIDNFERFNYQSYEEIAPYEQMMIQGTLLMSDSPEVVKKEGILYRDSIHGTGRILLHHINDFEADQINRTLVLVAENTTDKPIRMMIQNKTVKGPSEDSLYIGQVLLQDYLKGSLREDYTLNPGEKRVIYNSVNRKWLKGQCISGLMDIITDGAVTFTIAALAENDSIDMMTNLPFLDKDIHPRGTFNVTDIHYKVDLKTGSGQKLIIGKGTNEWVNGYDAITGELVQNRGNFGVLYRIEITAQEDMGVILNPRADIFRGAIRWENEGLYLMPGIGFFAGETTKAAVLGTIKAGETKVLEYMLPNGSSAPVLIGFIPKANWSK